MGDFLEEKPWESIFFQLCNGTRNGLGHLKKRLDRLDGNLRGIPVHQKCRLEALETLLRESVEEKIASSQPYSYRNNTAAREFYQHYFDHLVWLVHQPTIGSYPEQLVSYLNETLRKSEVYRNETFVYSTEQMLYLMAVTMYNREIDPKKSTSNNSSQRKQSP